MPDRLSVQVLSREECLRLLSNGGVGRISVIAGRAPVIRPVDFVCDGDRIVIRTGDSAIWRAAAGVGAGRVRD